jgi:hypothetical protein
VLTHAVQLRIKFSDAHQKDESHQKDAFRQGLIVEGGATPFRQGPTSDAGDDAEPVGVGGTDNGEEPMATNHRSSHPRIQPLQSTLVSVESMRSIPTLELERIKHRQSLATFSIL